MFTLEEFMESIRLILNLRVERDSKKLGSFDIVCKIGEPILRLNFRRGDFTWFSIQHKDRLTRNMAKEVTMGVLYNYQVWAEERQIKINWSVYEA